MQTLWRVKQDDVYLRMTKFYRVALWGLTVFTLLYGGLADIAWWLTAWYATAAHLGRADHPRSLAFANVVRGVPLNAAHAYTGNLLTCSTGTGSSAAWSRSACSPCTARSSWL
jgi:hypothetical protein